MSFKVKYKCTCKNNDHSMWWIPQKFEHKMTETGRREVISTNYLICVLNSAGNRIPVNYCPNCGIKLPDPIETLSEKTSGR